MSDNTFQHSKTLLLGLIGLVIVACGVAGLFAYNDHQASLIAAEQQRLKKEEEIKLAKTRSEFKALSDQYLTDFINDLKTQAAEYKQQKRVLKEMISPYNFETPDYSKENYDLFISEVAPSLRQSADHIIGLFEEYTQRLTADLQDHSNDMQAQFLQEWNEMSIDQLGQYVDFFAHEEKLIQAYEELIRFYYIHSNLYTVDVEANRFDFKRPQDRIKQAELLKAVKSLQVYSRPTPSDNTQTEN